MQRELMETNKIVPAGDGIYNEAFATLGHFLFLLFRLRKLPGFPMDPVREN
jgi:hypothetical protein